MDCLRDRGCLGSLLAKTLSFLASPLKDSRFSSVVSSTLIDLQEAQALFIATISVSTIAAFKNSQHAGLANVLSVFSYTVNFRIVRGLVTAGMFPLLTLQLILQRAGKGSWYTLFFVLLNWVFFLILTLGENAIDPVSFWEHLKKTSTVSACGDNPGPMSYCKGPTAGEDFAYFEHTRKLKLAVHVLVAFAVLDHVIAILKGLWTRGGEGKEEGHLSWFDIIIHTCWTLSQLLGLSTMGVGLHDLVRVFLGLYASHEDETSWSFGQLVALAIWFPVVFKFINLLFGKCN